ncbi:predicted protein [Naegleria gruberi]|uniref:Predicted protein n=1 Tax=Naegleria gruberi TaxID=5762 RepID=D2VF82_NAEGR|nr:uncharacterized protein NAEGRDRAFT_67532 [Naegleria gruberi]EFC44414.1 predicted protein [Naegleria gruberi]|eukprot:XP_002677158.1 predicted protein [Naegleria gruberi strain NEG-M]
MFKHLLVSNRFLHKTSYKGVFSKCSLSLNASFQKANISRCVIKPLTPDYAEQATILTSLTFSQSEPVNNALGYSPMDFYPFAKSLVSTACEQGLGTVAVDRDSGMVVATVYSEDFVKGMLSGPNYDVNKYRVIDALLGQLLDKYFSNPPQETGSLSHNLQTLITPEHVGKIAHVCIAGTYGFYASKGLMVHLAEAHLEQCKSQGYEQAFVECSGEYSRRVFYKLGFATKSKIIYDEFEMKDENGQVIRPFAGKIPKPHSSINMVWKYKL